MMCDFKPGDEVVCIGDGEWICDTVPWWRFWRRKATGPRVGVVYVIAAIEACKKAVGLRLVGVKNPGPTGWWDAADFRKIQRRDLGEWLKTSISNTDRLDKRQTKKVRA